VHDAFAAAVELGLVAASPVRRLVAAVSVGIVDGEPRLDLDYEEDVRAAVDMNVVTTDAGGFVEVQGTGEHGTFDRAELDALLALAQSGIRTLGARQRTVLGLARRDGVPRVISPGGGSPARALLVATRNGGKRGELHAALAPLGFRLSI
jgi:hypothetical protein